MSSSSPYLSIVATSRNDNHGGRLLERMQAFVNGLVGQCQRHGLDAELILVEWNPPPRTPRLAEVLHWPEDTGPCCIRIIEVPARLHRRFKHARRLPVFQMIAKNVGIRRARGRFILATNIDVLFSDELMAFLARKQLDPDRMYRIDRHDVAAEVPIGGTVEEQLRWCETHLLRVNGRCGTYPVTPDGGLALCPQDILTPDRGVMLGSGWFPATLENGEPMRWVDNEAELILQEKQPAGRVLTLEIESGPGVGYRPFELEVRDEAGRPVARGLIGRHELVSWRLPSPEEQTRRYYLCPIGGGLPTPNDWRTLNFRVWRCRWGIPDSPRSATEVVPDNWNIDTRPAPLLDHPTILADVDLANAETGLRFGFRWHRVEQWHGQRFRWAASGAVLLAKRPRGERRPLTLAMEPGPGVDYQPFELQVRDAQGNVVAGCRVNGEELVCLDLPLPDDEPRHFTFHVEGGGRSAAYDSRILDFRVFSPIRWGLPPLRLHRRMLVKQIKRLVPGLAARAKQDFLDRAREAGSGIVSPEPLHVNACGDFTLLAREHWFSLHGYPELEVFSLNIDTLFCYMAHHGGARETVLPEPMRTYHIEHGTGSGWTPEGEGALLQRISSKKIPILDAGEVLARATRMRRQGRPMIYNDEDWGMGRETLKEITIEDLALSATV